MARRRVSEEERALLAQAMRAVTPIRKRNRLKSAGKAQTTTVHAPLAREADAPRSAQSAAGGQAPRPEAVRAARPPGLPRIKSGADLPRKRGRTEKTSLHAIDRRMDQKLKRGQIEIDATLDLHGLSQERAHVRLNAFLARASLDGHRTVLVITGKGRPAVTEDGLLRSSGRGVLRACVPRWIEEAPLRGLVWGVRPAGARHGGDGALYVLLRKVKGA